MGMAAERRHSSPCRIKLDIAQKRTRIEPMGREIKLDGGEISILKKIGLSGSPLNGTLLLDRIEEMETGEFLDSLSGLIDQGYVLSKKVNIRLIEDVGKAF